LRRAPAEIALSAGVLGLGAFAAAVTAQLSGEGGYAGFGPNFVPAVVAAGLLIVGTWLLWEALAGGWRNRGEAEAGAEHAFHASACVWISAGLFAHMALIGWAGFVVAGTVLFPCVARGFGSARVLRDVAMGFALSLAVFAFFVTFLHVNLPAGWLQPLLGSAGI
jgi:putative tricarboxylic transport membrane protein